MAATFRNFLLHLSEDLTSKNVTDMKFLLGGPGNVIPGMFFTFLGYFKSMMREALQEDSHVMITVGKANNRKSHNTILSRLCSRDISP